MDLNKIKLFNKGELLGKLKQSGFEETAKILEDIDINGQSFIELKEFEVFKWRLNPSQKRNLWNCIEQIKKNPSKIVAQEKPKPLKKSIPTKTKDHEASQSNKLFKEKLQGSLTNIGGGNPRIARNKKPLPTTSNENKPLPLTPPPSPPPRTDSNRQTDNTCKRAVLPLPKETVENDQTYLIMLPPTQLGENIDGEYLIPNEVSLPPNHKNKSPNLPRRLAEEKPTQKLDDDRNKFHSSKGFGKQPDGFSEEMSENANTKYQLSPQVNNNMQNKSPTNTLSKKSTNQQAFDGDANNSKEFPASLSNYVNSPIRKPSLKNLGLLADVLVIEEPQPEPIFSVLTSKFNIFKTRKQKNVYENHTINGKERAPVEILVRNRPLPEPPQSPQLTANTSSLFTKPFPPPRDITVDLNPHENYVELTDNSLLVKNPITTTLETPDSSQIYDDTTNHTASWEDEDIYENTRQEIYENGTSKQEEEEEEESFYENSKDVQQKITGHHVASTSANEANPKGINDQPPRIHDLAFLLQQKLEERKTRQQNAEEIENEVKTESESDSRFSDHDDNFDDDFDDNYDDDDDFDDNYDDDDHEPQLYSNISNVKMNLSEHSNDEEMNGNPSQEQNIPIYKRTLPEIPNDNKPILTAPKGVPTQKSEPIAQRNPNKNFNLPVNKDTSKAVSKISNSVSPIPPGLREDRFKGSTNNQNVNDSSRDDKPTNIGATSRPLKPKLPERSKPNKCTRIPTTIRKHDSFKEQQACSRKSTSENEKHFNPIGTTGASIPASKNYEYHVTDDSGKSNTKNTKTASNIVNIINLSKEPFFRNTNRTGAKQILSNLGDGAFLFRPSSLYFLGLTVKYNKKIHNFGIERSTNNTLRLITQGNMESPEFTTLKDFVAYFSEEPVTFEEDDELREIYLKPYLLQN